MQSKISSRMKNETLQMLRLMLKLGRKSLGVSVPDTSDDPTESEIAGASRQAGNHDAWVSTSDEYLFPARQPWRPAGVVISGVSALLAWFLASWASKVAPCFIGDAGGQCPTREAASTQRDDSDQVLQAVKFTDKKVPGLHLDLDEEFQAAGCFTEVIRGYQMG